MKYKMDDASIDRGLLGQRIDFKTLGYKTIFHLLKDVPEVQLSNNRAQLRQNAESKDEIFRLIKEHKGENGWINISILGQKKIDFKKLGYKKLSDLLKGMPDIEFRDKEHVRVVQKK